MIQIINFLSFGKSKILGIVISLAIFGGVTWGVSSLVSAGFEAKFQEPYAKPYKDSLLISQKSVILLDSLNKDLETSVLSLKNKSNKDSLNWEGQKVSLQRTIQNVRYKASKEVDVLNDSLTYYKGLVGRLKDGTACMIESNELFKKNRTWVLVDCETKEPI